MPEYDVTFSFEKTFEVKAKTKETAQEKATEMLAEYMQDNEDMIKVEVHHVEA